MNTVYTIGFTKKSAEHFFTLLRNSGAERLLDVRLNNRSQLAAFAKAGKDGGGDLGWLLAELCGMDYQHLPELAPTQEMLEAYRKGGLRWDLYARRYRALLRQRQVEHILSPESLANGVLLCSEHEPDRCHRRLAARYLQRAWEDVEIIDLV